MHLLRLVTIGVALLGILSLKPANAMGVGKGLTKIDFQLKVGDFTSSRLFAKLNVSGAVTSNGNSFFGNSSNGHGHGNGRPGGSNNFALAGYDVTLIIGSASFTGIADSKGKVSTPFAAKLTANGGILQIMANGLNLEELFPIDKTDGPHTVTVLLVVTANKAATATTGAVSATLSSQNVTFNYVVKNGRVKGSNF